MGSKEKTRFCTNTEVTVVVAQIFQKFLVRFVLIFFDGANEEVVKFVHLWEILLKYLQEFSLERLNSGWSPGSGVR